MRYQNWDVLLFPEHCKIPLQEFRTTCQAIQDTDCHPLHNGTILLPTVTCFVPGLPARSPFRVSIHSWETPDIGRLLQQVKKTGDQILFEARVFIDGRVVGSKWFNETGPWPTVLDVSMGLDKHGEFEKLRFPPFHKELVSQSYWNAGDDLGRIKLVISEGFARDGLAFPFERVKNIVAFSFQHAPLELLETSSIAWPNAGMWRQVSLIGSYFAQQSPTRELIETEEIHSHSPRRTGVYRTIDPRRHNRPTVGSMLPPSVPPFPRTLHYDPFTEPAIATYNHSRAESAADVSMPDFSGSSSRMSNSRVVTDPMMLDRTLPRFESMQNPGAYEYTCEALLPAAPVNTPQNGERTPLQNHIVPPRLATEDFAGKVGEKGELYYHPDVLTGCCITESVKSHKDIYFSSPHAAETVPEAAKLGSSPPVIHLSPRPIKAIKRQRLVTPAAPKVIDKEDEPKSSPLHHAAADGTKQPVREGERRVLSGIVNI